MRYQLRFTDGQAPVTVTSNLFDQRNFEVTLRKNKAWGSLQDNLLRMNAFRAWSAARRQGLIDLTWEQFYEDPNSPVSSVIEVPADDDDEDEVEGLGKDTPMAQ